MQKLDGTRLGDKKIAYLKKSLCFNKKIAYNTEEVGVCQISDTKSFSTKNRLFLTQNAYFYRNCLFKKTRLFSTKNRLHFTVLKEFYSMFA